MSKVLCKNCGAEFDGRRTACPYCGTMNKKGAYADFRAKISALIDSMLGLKDDVERSVSRIVLTSLLRALLIIIVIIGLAATFSRFSKINYRNDKEYDQKAYEELVWIDENLDKLNEAYESGDYKTVAKLYYEQPNAVRSWSLYPSYCVKSAYKKAAEDPYFGVGQLQHMLHFIFNPEYFTGHNGMNRVDADEYAEMRSALIAQLEEKGYSSAELEQIYDKCSDSYGYVSIDLLKEYVKEDGNG